MDIIEEVKHELRSERVEAFWRKVGKFAVILAIVGICFSILYLWYDNYRINKLNTLGSDYMVASLKMQAKESDKGLKLMETIAHKKEGNYSAIAALNNASHFAMNKDFTKAIEYYASVKDDPKNDQVFREFAYIMWNSVQLDAKVIDIKQAIKNLEAYSNSSSVFWNYANEQLAVLYIADNNKSRAVEVLNNIMLRSSTSPAEKGRAKQLMVLVK